MLIYGIRSRVSGKLYIGATSCSLDERIARHYAAAFAEKKHGVLYDAMRSEGMAGFDVSVLSTCESDKEMWALERALIAEHGSLVPAGFNERPGRGGWRQGLPRGPMSEAHRQKIAKAQRGRRAWNKGIPHTYVARMKMRGRKTWNKGVPRTEAEKANMRAAIQRSRAHGKYHPMCKAIECDGTIYPSVRDMERRTGLSRSGIYYRLGRGRARFVTS